MMLSFQDFLRESLSTPYSWQWDESAIRRTERDVVKVVTHREAYFETPDPLMEFHVEFTKGISWWATFAPTRESLDDVSGSWHKDVYEVLGTGNAFRVFATVIDIMKAFVQLEHPDTIRFVGGGVEKITKTGKQLPSSRDRLYQRFAKYAGRALPGYTQEEEPVVGNSTYTLKRIGATDDAVTPRVTPNS